MGFFRKAWDRIQGRSVSPRTTAQPDNAPVAEPDAPKNRPERRLRIVSANRSIRTAGDSIKTHLRGVQRSETAPSKPKLRQNDNSSLQTRILQRVQRAPATAQQIAKSLHAKQSRIGHHLQMLLRNKQVHRNRHGEYVYHAGRAD